MSRTRRQLAELVDPAVLADPALVAEIAADLAPGRPGDRGELHVRVIAALARVDVRDAARALCELQDLGVAAQLATDPTVWRLSPRDAMTVDDLRMVLVALVRTVLDADAAQPSDDAP